jgi:hypothetical protein
MSILHNETNHRSPGAFIVELWHEWTRNAACPSDLAACSLDEVDRWARDVGLSANELQRLARRGPHASDLLFRRMAALDLNPEEVAEVDRATFLDLERVCTFCDCKGRCKRDFARRPDDAEWEDYCPNVATLKMLDALPWSSRREW